MNSRDLLASSATLSRELLTIIHSEPSSIDRIAADLAEAVGATMPDHDAVATVVVDRARSAQAGTAREARDLSGLEARLGAGPTTCAMAELRVVGSGDDTLRAPDEWTDAVDRAGYRQVVAAPIVVAGAAAGAITVYGRGEPDPERDRQLAAMSAHQAAIVVEGGRRLVQLRDAVASRDVIGQAKGILMNRFGIDAATAFGRLVEASQDMNVKLVDIARWYVTDQDGSTASPRPS